jgi:hypothetical protein
MKPSERVDPMTNLNNRLQKIEGALDNMPGGSNEIMMFFRHGADDRTPEKWISENPGFRGTVHIFSFGTKNVGLQHQSSNN